MNIPKTSPHSVSHQPASAAGDTLSKILAVTAVVAAVAIAVVLLKNRPEYLAGAALIGTVIGFGAMFLLSNETEEPAAPADDAGTNLARVLETNRTEFTARIAELKKSLDAHKSDNSAAQENAAIRAEIARLRVELTALGGTLAGR